jgi:hypothetical protein
VEFFPSIEGRIRGRQSREHILSTARALLVAIADYQFEKLPKGGSLIDNEVRTLPDWRRPRILAIAAGIFLCLSLVHPRGAFAQEKDRSQWANSHHKGYPKGRNTRKKPVLFINKHTGVELCFFIPKGGI